jgi:S-formylglutathione hydrolase
MIEQIANQKSFNGWQQRFTHQSSTLNCAMTFSIYMPPQAEHTAVPVLYWLSGLTCTDENFSQKSGAQKYAAKYGVAIVIPDTSPRGDDVPGDPEGKIDFGHSAGFYLNATQQPWAKHYQMYSYITEELPAIINANFLVDGERSGIFGHSMGGHGALTIGLKNTDKYRSVSALAPICAPIQCGWGEKAFSNYLGSDKATWRDYDACELIAKATKKRPLLVDQGSADPFLKEQLKTDLLRDACAKANYPLQLHVHDGYDHSYFFVASFIESHIKFHAEHLNHI